MVSEPMLKFVVVLLAGLCVVEFACLIFMFNNYKSMMEQLVIHQNEGLVLPQDKESILEKIKEDRVVQETRQKSQDFLDLFKTGECDDKDAAYFGVNTHG